MEARIDGHTTMLALFGSPVGHSGSPAMYNYSFENAGINYAYLAFDIKENEMASALEKMRVLKMRGANITMPCKKIASELVDHLSPAAQLIGAVNTIVNNEGVLTGYNTDGAGYVINLRQHGISPEGKTLTLLGAGGASTAIAVQMALDGVKEIHIFNPKDAFYHNAELIADKIMSKVSNCRVTVDDINDQTTLKSAIEQSNILANATKAGMAPNVEQTNIKDTSVFRPDLVVTDTVYSPALTKMLKDAKEHGSQIIGGKGMLVQQGASAFKLYTGENMPVDDVKKLFF
ncbi:shikimate dehydrogenase [Companilactobacillus alimentarius]|uniref:Shikimate dehydrogenase (NADP(+)) n=1 Tax=Companilactobacillus alimentarius DSM 20249 TaxID=1423720 RepID=A0A2K9HJV3_9LACO|nr:shikimate dehydrogenase [Companilactobacillus alimentarius]AUI72046.1 shikimate dehydrogenase [Companilactobacillus alimentarius DSM 20249]KRK78001.1 shikimate 5-dehydrogenase [Companilactobacillus alimentarius DSM 20249]MDT6952583.1 shikimate dehydrogenase [Companilactobacillus alimentarius]GEO44819.1 shikimate dehydrogenase (NADP(+)) [Companilactobacillus alimentarius]